MLAGLLVGGAAAGGRTGQRAQRGGHLGRGVRVPRVPSEETHSHRYVFELVTKNDKFLLSLIRAIWVTLICALIKFSIIVLC